MKRLIGTLLLAAIATFAMAQEATTPQNVVINEVMQSNIDFLMVDKDFPDSWLELYNPTSSAISVTGWRIGTKAVATDCWRIPTATIPAGGHLVIYCDKEDNGMHSDFRIDSGKSSLYLFDAGGTQVDMLALKKMPAANVAYGRTSDGAGEWYYEYTPTPGTANSGGGDQTVLPQPVFSYTGGVFDSAPEEWLRIEAPEGTPAGCRIAYTTNGKEPNATSPGGIGYASFPITKTTVVRAKIISISGQGVPSRSVAQSYIIHPRQTDLPIISLLTDDAYLNDDQIGILSKTVNDGVPNYMQKWRRPVSIEYFGKDGHRQWFSQEGETAVSGATTREQPQKSLKVYANKRFGTKNFAGQFWDDKPGVTAVKSFILRCGGNYSFQSRINDAAAQTLFGRHTDNLDWQAYQPVIVYLNGQFFGEYGMRERSDEDFVESNYGIEDIEMADENSYQTPEDGTLFKQFYDLYHTKGVTYEQFDAVMDMDNFLKSVVAEIYGQNTDFPTNNVAMWRPLDGAVVPEGIQPGKWRWILKDMDRFGYALPMYPYSFDMIRYMFSPDDLVYGGLHHFDLYKKMITFPEFRDRLIDMLTVGLGDWLRPELVNPLIEEMRDEIRAEVQPTFKLYGQNFNDFLTYTDYMMRAVNSRPDNLCKQMAAYFGLGDVIGLTVDAAGCSVLMNGTPLTTGTFSGSCYSKRSLSFSAPEGSQWKVSVKPTSSSEPIVSTYTTPDITIPVSTLGLSAINMSSLAVECIPGEPTGIHALPATINAQPMFNLQGQRIATPSRGIVIVNGRKCVVK